MHSCPSTNQKIWLKQGMYSIGKLLDSTFHNYVKRLRTECSTGCKPEACKLNLFVGYNE